VTLSPSWAARPLAHDGHDRSDNLHRKGWLTRERDGRAWRYRPALSRQEHAALLMNDALSASSDRAGAGPVRRRDRRRRRRTLAQVLEDARAQRRQAQQ
jgi:predicted transcriptional regulator